MVLRRSADASDVLTGGQDTVAVRVPAHPMAQQLLTAFGGAIAAPSANRFGRLSPTRAEHVRDEFGDLVRIVLDGGECTIGLESTIVSLVGERPRLLRPGHVTAEQVAAVVGPIDVGPDPSAPRVPGTLAHHYAPGTPLELVAADELEGHIDYLVRERRRLAVLARRAPYRARNGVTWINASRRPEVFAHDLYANLRLLDKAGADLILVETVPSDPAWAAVTDRLARSAVNPH